MTRAEFDKIFHAVIAEVNEPVATEEGLFKMLESYTENASQITLYEMFNILFIESRKYTDNLTYKLFSELLEFND